MYNPGMDEKQKHRQPWQAWLCAAPMPIVGLAIGLYLADASFARHVASIHAESPDAPICGLPFIPGMFAGFFGGSLGGIVAGGLIAEFVTRIMCRRENAN